MRLTPTTVSEPLVCDRQVTLCPPFHLIHGLHLNTWTALSRADMETQQGEHSGVRPSACRALWKMSARAAGAQRSAFNSAFRARE
jgi:hypothetical protein